MPRAKAASPHAGRAVLSFTAAGHSWSVSTPLTDATPRSMSGAMTELFMAIAKQAEPELHPKKSAKNPT